MGWPEVAMKMMALALEVMTSRMVVLFILCHGDVTSLKKKDVSETNNSHQKKLQNKTKI